MQTHVSYLLVCHHSWPAHKLSLLLPAVRFSESETTDPIKPKIHERVCCGHYVLLRDLFAYNAINFTKYTGTCHEFA